MLPAALIGRPVSFDNRIVKKLTVVFSLVIAVFFGLVAASNWQEILKYISSTAFGTVDPILNRDIGFYIFSLPVFQTGLGLIKFLVLSSFVGSAIIFFCEAALIFRVYLRRFSTPRSPRFEEQAYSHSSDYR